MKIILTAKKTTAILALISISSFVFAGNKDRVGQAGGTEMLINPWSQSSGMGSANTASVTGLESMHLNIAGLAFTNKTELLFSRSTWLSSMAGIGINSFGIAQRVGESSVLGIGVMSMSFGDIPITTVDQPEGGIGTFSPQFLNLGLSYAKAFSNSIFGGLTVKSISQSISNASRGVAFDAGVRYVTGEKDNIKFGITLRNVGPKMKFSGDGFATKVVLNGEEFTLEQRTEGFELPSVLSIGAAYDILVVNNTDSTGKNTTVDHKVTLAGDFTSNSFGKDQIRFGVEYGFKALFTVRGGYVYEKGVGSANDFTHAFSGPAAGFSFQVPMGGDAKIGLDYSYRATKSFSGVHSIGARITI
jgi:hypothetical protein